MGIATESGKESRYSNPQSCFTLNFSKNLVFGPPPQYGRSSLLVSSVAVVTFLLSFIDVTWSSASPPAHAPWPRTSWHLAVTSGGVRTRTRGTTRRDTCPPTTNVCRCCCPIASWASSWFQARARGTTTSWVSFVVVCLRVCPRYLFARR